MFAEKVNPEDIKGMIRDIPELNVLLSYEDQFDDEEIFRAARLAEQEAFARFPVMRTKDIPEIIINYLVISYLLQSVGAQELRNQMQINDNNVGAIDYSNKFPQYSSLSQQYKNEAFQMLQTMAANDYYTSMWGSVASNSYEIEGGDD